MIATMQNIYEIAIVDHLSGKKTRITLTRFSVPN
jgi:hypothetical protein